MKKLTVDHTFMALALQYYFDNILFAEHNAPVVEDVQQGPQASSDFEIRLKQFDPEVEG